MNTDNENSESFEYFEIDDFLKKFNRTGASLARALGVHRQQITNWQNSSAAYFIKLNLETDEVSVHIPEKKVKSCKLEEIGF